MPTNNPWTDSDRWPPGSDTFVESFAKGLAVIAAFSHQRDLSLSDVARQAGVTRAGARRLLYTLVALGFAEQRGEAFALTPRVLQLGFAYLSALSLREMAQPVIEQLSRETNEVVAVSVLDGADVTYIARAEVTSVLRRGLTVGSRIPAYCTSMGRVLLAALPTDELRAWLADADIRAWTHRTTTDRKKLATDIAQVRRQGWSIVSEQLELGAAGIAVPVLGQSGETIAALNLSTNLARHSSRELVRDFLPRLQAASGRISERLPPAHRDGARRRPRPKPASLSRRA